MQSPLTKTMSGEEVTRELIATLSINLGIASGHILAAMRDRCSINGAAMRTIKVMYPHVLDVECFSHMLNLTGKKFKTPQLDECIKLWISLFAPSPQSLNCLEVHHWHICITKSLIPPRALVGLLGFN